MNVHLMFICSHILSIFATFYFWCCYFNLTSHFEMLSNVLVQVSDGLAFSKENIICTSISCYRMEMQENLIMEIEYQTEQSSNFKRIIWTEKLWFSYNWVSYWFESLSDLVIPVTKDWNINENNEYIMITCNSLYWHLLTCIAMYWYILIPTGTYWHVLTHIDTHTYWLVSRQSFNFCPT